MDEHVLLHHAHQVLLADVEVLDFVVVAHASWGHSEALLGVANECEEGFIDLDIKASCVRHGELIVGYADGVRPVVIETPVT